MEEEDRDVKIIAKVQCPYCFLWFAVCGINRTERFICEDCQLLGLAGSLD